MDDSSSLLAPLPEPFTIPAQSIEAWSRIPAAEYIDVRLTKGDIDHLFFAVDKLIHAGDSTSTAVGAAMVGDTALAHTHLRLATSRLIEAQNNLRQLMAAFIACGTVEQKIG